MSRTDGDAGPSQPGEDNGAARPAPRSSAAGRPPRSSRTSAAALSDARREQLASIERVRAPRRTAGRETAAALQCSRHELTWRVVPRMLTCGSRPPRQENAELMARLASLRTRDEAAAHGGSEASSGDARAMLGHRRNGSSSRSRSRSGSRGAPGSGELGVPPTPRTPRTPGRVAARSPADAAAAVARLRAERAQAAQAGGAGAPVGIRLVAKEVACARQRAVSAAKSFPGGTTPAQRVARRSIGQQPPAPASDDEESPAAAMAAAGGSVRAVAAALEQVRRHNSSSIRRTL